MEKKSDKSYNKDRDLALSPRDKLYVKRLTDIVIANLKNEHFGVSQLAQEMGNSRSYIYRRLKALTTESVSQFICRIRLEKAIDLLQEGELTISEVAYDVGFGSPSYFIKCFHECYGYSPGDFLKNNKKENKEKDREWWKNQFWFLVIVVVVAGVLSGIYFSGDNVSNELPKSIAVLPLKNLSTKSEIQFLGDGIMEEILNRLSYIHNLDVRSSVTAEKYRNPIKTIPEIAQELKVKYVLTGSILKDGEKVRLYVQLIDAGSDKQLWTDQYDYELEDILHFVSDVSRQIANKLQTELTTGEIDKIEKVYTTDNEAYNLYLKGRFFWHRRTEVDVNKSIFYYRQAIEGDPGFALVYAGLGECYLVLSIFKWIPVKEGVIKCKEYLTKALELDPMLPEAHAALGSLECYFNWNWQFVEQEFTKAINLNPNYATAHQYYAEYLTIMGAHQEARGHINRALELNSTSMMMNAVSSICYYQEKKIAEALKSGEKALELGIYKYQNVRNFFSYYYLDQFENALNELQKYLLLELPGENNNELLERIYKESGIKGVAKWTIHRLILEDEPDDYFIARFYAILSEKDSVLVYLNKELNTGIRGPFMKYNPDFEFLHEDSRFKALLKKMNMPED
uniref:helix-turn-helix domain-containing protein n=1 Tax=uncultured Draconibacterium sp. TaxID=1573823 RepID=UPI003216CE83